MKPDTIFVATCPWCSFKTDGTHAFTYTAARALQRHAREDHDQFLADEVAVSRVHSEPVAAGADRGPDATPVRRSPPIGGR